MVKDVTITANGMDILIKFENDVYVVYIDGKVWTNRQDLRFALLEIGRYLEQEASKRLYFLKGETDAID